MAGELNSSHALSRGSLTFVSGVLMAVSNVGCTRSEYRSFRSPVLDCMRFIYPKTNPRLPDARLYCDGVLGGMSMLGSGNPGGGMKGMPGVLKGLNR